LCEGTEEDEEEGKIIREKNEILVKIVGNRNIQIH
jgi:hypothetical protein